MAQPPKNTAKKNHQKPAAPSLRAAPEPALQESLLRGKAGRLVEIYNRIDHCLQELDTNDGAFLPFSRRVLKLSDTVPIVREYRRELALMADLRNLIVHESVSKLNPILEPHDLLMTEFETILRRMELPPLAIDHIAITIHDIYAINMDTKLTVAMKHMHAQGYSHVPILDYGKVIGVFSERALFTFIVEKGAAALTPQLVMRDLIDTVNMSNRAFQRERYRFVSRDTPIQDVENLFWRHTKQNRRLAVIFITDTGDRNEKLLGMITAADLAGYRDDR